LDFESLVSSTYNLYAIHIFDFNPSSNGANLRFQTSEDNGSSYNTSNFRYHVSKSSSAGSSYNASTSTSAEGYLLSDNVKSDNIENFHGILYISADFGSAYQPRVWHHGGDRNDAAHTVFHAGFGEYNGSQSSATNAFRLKFNTGDISSGTAVLYGLAKS
jgi:hypothetical protein